MIRALLFASAALIAAPAAAQDHSAHQNHGAMDHSQHQVLASEPQAMDHSAHQGLDHSQMDHGSMDHSQRQMPVSEPQVMDHSAHQGMDHSQMDHGAMDHSAMGHGAPVEEPASVDHSEMNHGTMDHGAMDHSQMDHGAVDHAAMGHAMSADIPTGPPPARAFEGPKHAADAIFGSEPMAEARAYNHRTHGGMLAGTLMAERLEARIADGHEAYLWDVQGWYGGDLNRLVVKSEGEGEFGGSVEDAEVQALFSRAITPWFDLQAGARVDLEPETRTHAVLGVQGLAPYNIHVDAAAFLSDRGDLTARIEAEHDMKLTQRLILQPRVEAEFSAQDIPERETGSGLSKIEAGVRLRYEIVREFAPYIGLEYEAKTGRTGDYARAAGEDPDGLVALVGIRAWF